MQETETRTPDTDSDPRAAWLMRMADLGEERGYFEPLGSSHYAFFSDNGPNLLVTFETVDALVAAGQADPPFTERLTHAHGWSHLAIIADGQTWYRDHWVWGYFDRLIDEGFFEDFDRTAFFGIGMGGYAACAYSVAAPGSTVVAIRPVSTLDPAIVPWDRRHLSARRLDFTSRFGFAPDMVDGAARIYLLHDPEVDEDAMHAALFRKRFAVRLNCRHAGPNPEQVLTDLDLLAPLLVGAMKGTLTRLEWARLWRARRNHAGWLRNVVVRLIEGQSRLREAVFLRSAIERAPGHRRLRKRMEELTGIMARDGLTMPPKIG